MNSDITAISSNSLAQIKPLLGAVEPIVGECMMSLLARAATKNVFPRVRELVRSADIRTSAPEFIPFTGAQAVPALSKLLSVDQDVIESLMHPAVHRDRPIDKVNWYGTCLPRRFIEAKRRRLSPVSFASAEYVRAVWQVRPLPFCPESMELLIHKCLNCQSDIGWRLRRGFHVCETCGRSLRRGKPGKIEWSLRSEARALAALVDPNPETRLRAMRVLPPIFHDWEPGDAFVGAVELGLAFCFPDREEHKAISRKTASGDFSEFNVTHLITGYRAMLDWPGSLHRYLPTVVDDKRGDQHHRVGPFAKYFLWTQTYERPIALLIRNEVVETLKKNDLIPFGGNGNRAGWMKRPDRLTRNEAGKRFGIEPRIVGRLEKEGYAVIRLGTKKKRAFYDPETLAPSAAIYKSALRTHECAARIGIPTFCVAALARKGLIEAITDHDALIMARAPLYTEQSVTDLRMSLHRLPERLGTGRTLTMCMERQFHPEAWTDAIDALLRGKISVACAPESKDAPLAYLKVDVTDFNAFIAELPQRPIPADITVSNLIAGSLLGVPGDIVAKLVKAELLQGEFVNRIGKIRLNDLAEFSERCLFGGEGDFLSGRRGFSARMRAKGIEPIAVIGKHWIWSREKAKAELRADNMPDAILAPCSDAEDHVCVLTCAA